MPKLHTFLRLHVSDYKISGITSAGPVVTLVNVNVPVVATTSWWLHFTARVVA